MKKYFIPFNLLKKSKAALSETFLDLSGYIEEVTEEAGVSYPLTGDFAVDGNTVSMSSNETVIINAADTNTANVAVDIASTGVVTITSSTEGVGEEDVTTGTAGYFYADNSTATVGYHDTVSGASSSLETSGVGLNMSTDADGSSVILSALGSGSYISASADSSGNIVLYCNGAYVSLNDGHEAGIDLIDDFNGQLSVHDNMIEIVSAAKVKIALTAIPTYADDTTAGLGGLTAGELYKTALGILMIKL